MHAACRIKTCQPTSSRSSSSSGIRHCRTPDDRAGETPRQWPLHTAGLTGGSRRFDARPGTDKGPSNRVRARGGVPCYTRPVPWLRSAAAVRLYCPLRTISHELDARERREAVKASGLALTSVARCSRIQPCLRNPTGNRRRLRTGWRSYDLIGLPTELISEPKTAAMWCSQSSSSADRRKSAHAAHGCHKHP